MSKKPKAFSEANYEILRVTNSGEFIWNENADQMMRDPVSNPSIIHVLRALRQSEVIREENERLREALDRSLTDEQIRQIAASIDRSMPLESAKILFA